MYKYGSPSFLNHPPSVSIVSCDNDRLHLDIEITLDYPRLEGAVEGVVA